MKWADGEKGVFSNEKKAKTMSETKRDRVPKVRNVLVTVLG